MHTEINVDSGRINLRNLSMTNAAFGKLNYNLKRKNSDDLPSEKS